jgi:hypothetical protein
VYASRGGGDGDGDKTEEEKEEDRSLFHCKVQSVSTLTPYDIYQGLVGKTQFKQPPNTECNGGDGTVGGFWIIPYDANPRTKLPSSMFQGHHAHYGVIIGIMVVVVAVAPTDSSGSSSETRHGTNNSSNTSSSDPNGRNVVKLLPLLKMDDTTETTTTTTTTTPTTTTAHDDKVSSDGLSPKQLLSTTSTKKEEDATTIIFVLVQHSLSKELCIAPWHEFVASNQQLISYDESKYLGPTATSTVLDLRNRIVSIGPNNHHHHSNTTTTSM